MPFLGGGGIEVKEADGAPDVRGVTQIVVSNGTLTDNGGGSVTIQTGGGGSGVQDQIWDYLAANNGDPIDAKLTIGSYIVLLFLKGNNIAGWTIATNARHTVSAGKTLVLVHYTSSNSIQNDAASRQMDLYNITDGTEIMSPAQWRSPNISYDGDIAVPSRLLNVPAGKTVALRLWNIDATKRAMGGYAVFKEV